MVMNKLITILSLTLLLGCSVDKRTESSNAMRCPYSGQVHHDIKHNIYNMCKMEAELKADSIINLIDFERFTE